MVGKHDRNGKLTEFIDGTFGCKRNLDLEHCFTPGIYCIYAEVEWNSQTNSNLADKLFTVSTYSSNHV